MKSILPFIVLLYGSLSQAQVNSLSGIIGDARTHEKLSAASITLYSPTGARGGVSNKEGKFSINGLDRLDSVKFSMIGYRSKLYTASALAREMSVPAAQELPTHPGMSFMRIDLEPEPVLLGHIIVRPISLMEIVRQAAQKLDHMIPTDNFGSNAFYREIIRDSLHYYSVAEAIFSIQFSPAKKTFSLRLEKGRSKEDVAYTRLFEDFHPGGGPEDAASQSMITRRPDFLSGSKLKNFVYKKDSSIRLDDRLVYIISFDQRPEVHEALEKGRMFIDADDFSLLKFEAETSPAGKRYIKSLKGTDKIFAELLHIDLTVKGWSRKASYTNIGGELLLAYADLSYGIGYRQPKKAIDLDLLINTEWMTTDFRLPILQEIKKGEVWKRKDLVANLPTDYDSAFWGANTILSPTAVLKEIIDSLSRKNNDQRDVAVPGGWEYLNKELFLAGQNGDSISLIPLARCAWEDNDAGGMLYTKMTGDLSIEARLSITKRSHPSQAPDNGFQQGGLILRSAAGKLENSFLFSMGTGGNDVPKYFVKRTIAGKTKALVDRTDSLTSWLRIERRGHRVSLFRRADKGGDWIKLDDYEADWLMGELQAGLSIMARFAGNGPRQRPDIKAVFSNVKIAPL